MHSFKTYIVDETNRQAYEACQALARGEGEPVLFLYGASGAGKTHLLRAIEEERRCSAPDTVTLYIPLELSAYNWAEGWALPRADYLLLDEIADLKGRTATQEYVAGLLAQVLRRGTQLVLTSVWDPSAYPVFFDTLRCAGVPVRMVRFEQPDPELRKARTIQLAEEQGVDLPPEIVGRIVDRAAGNLSRIPATVNHLAFLQRMEGALPVSRMAAEVDSIWGNAPRLSQKDPEGIRYLLNSAGLQGALKSLKEVIRLLAEEAIDGDCRRLEVTLCKDGGICLRSVGGGAVLDDTPVEGKPAWYNSFCRWYDGSKSGQEMSADEQRFRWYEVTSEESSPFPMEWKNMLGRFTVPQQTSAYMTVVTVRQGVRTTLRFRKGYAVAALRAKTEEPSGMMIRFQPDPEVFGGTEIPFAEVERMLRELAVTIAGLECVLIDERTGESARHFYPGGVRDYAGSCLAGEATPLWLSEQETVEQTSSGLQKPVARLQVVLAFTRRSAPVECYHNYRLLNYGGTHLQVLKRGIRRALRAELPALFAAPAKKKELAGHMLLIVNSYCPVILSAYENGSCEAICSRTITAMAQAWCGEGLRDYLHQNRSLIQTLLG